MSLRPSTRFASPNASAGHPPPYNGRSASCRGESTDDPMTRLFGTDGIRGVANDEPLTPELAFRVARQLVATLGEHGTERVRIVIGRDTRISGELLESAMVSGVLSAGGECYTVGVLPTPGIALLTRALEAQGGIRSEEHT